MVSNYTRLAGLRFYGNYTEEDEAGVVQAVKVARMSHVKNFQTLEPTLATYPSE